MPLPPSSDSMKISYLDREAFLSRLKKIARQIKAERPEVIGIRLFGSLARGDYTAASDADVLIVLRYSHEGDLHRRIMTFLPYFELDHGVDLLVYTQSEIEARLHKGDPFFQRIWEESMEIDA